MSPRLPLFFRNGSSVLAIRRKDPRLGGRENAAASTTFPVCVFVNAYETSSWGEGRNAISTGSGTDRPCGTAGNGKRSHPPDSRVALGWSDGLYSISLTARSAQVSPHQPVRVRKQRPQAGICLDERTRQDLATVVDWNSCESQDTTRQVSDLSS